MSKRGGNFNNRKFGGKFNQHSNQRNNYTNANMSENAHQTYKKHDDRDRQRSKRRVSFKPIGRKPGFSKMAESGIRSRLECDEEMSDLLSTRSESKAGGSRSRYTRKGSPIPRKQILTRDRRVKCCEWFIVRIPFGQNVNRRELEERLRLLAEPLTFTPYAWKVEAASVRFYVDDYEVARKISHNDRSIQVPGGYKINVHPSIPIVQFDDESKQKITLVMAKRYNATTKALDLTKFHADPDLVDVFCPLARSNIISNIFNILIENISDLVALNLNDNAINILDQFKSLAGKLNSLKILHLAKNRIKSISSIDSLKELPLVELLLEGNPLKDRFRDKTNYISDVRKRLPSLLKLDDNELPPSVGFDVVKTTLPETKQSFFCDASGIEIVRRFIEQYITVYDSDRSRLLDAYHDNALFSMTVQTAQQQNERLTAYWPHNRNLLRLRDLDVKCVHLHKGKLAVVTMISKLPRTQHDLQSFTVDLTIFSPNIISFTLTGTFKDIGVSESSQNWRGFTRFFVIVPHGQGFLISNDMLHVCYINKPPQSQSSSTSNPSTSRVVLQPAMPMPSTSTAIPAMPAIPAVPNEVTMQAMVQSLSTQTKMNLEWSKKCLEETNWNFDNAVHIFKQLFEQNKIPPQAF